MSYVCRVCKEPKEKYEMSTNGTCKNGVETVCKDCKNEQGAIYRRRKRLTTDDGEIKRAAHPRRCNTLDWKVVHDPDQEAGFRSGAMLPGGEVNDLLQRGSLTPGTVFEARGARKVVVGRIGFPQTLSDAGSV